jgi:hypothetical protein
MAYSQIGSQAFALLQQAVSAPLRVGKMGSLNNGYPRMSMAIGLALTLSVAPAANNQAEASLAGTMYEAPALEYDLDPVLLYSVALAESARGADSQLQPWPYTLRVLSEAGFYGQSHDEAVEQLQRYLQNHGSVDIGIMQVNTRWHGHRVEDVTQLLDPAVGLRVGAEILREAIDSAPGDLVLGLGRYHNWADEERARNYGQRILAIYRNIRDVLGGAE